MIELPVGWKGESRTRRLFISSAIARTPQELIQVAHSLTSKPRWCFASTRIVSPTVLSARTSHPRLNARLVPTQLIYSHGVDLYDSVHTAHHHNYCRPCTQVHRLSQTDESFLLAICEEGRLDAALDTLTGMQAPPSTTCYVALLKACNKRKSLIHVKQIHAHITKFTAEITGFLADYLVMTLAICGAVEDALLVSPNLSCLTVFSWTAIISAYVDRGCEQKALQVYQSMQQHSVEPNSYTFVCLFRACGSIPDISKAKELHADARRKGYGSDLFVCTALLSIYSKCGAMMEAEDVFISLSKHDVVACNAMLSAYVEQGQAEKALLLYRQMQEEGIGMDHLTIVATLRACGMLVNRQETSLEDRFGKAVAQEIGRSLHVEARHRGFTSNCFVGSAIVSMYSTCGSITEVELFFCSLLHKDIVSWNALLSAYAEWGQAENVLLSYTQIEDDGNSPNEITHVIALQACGTLAEDRNASNTRAAATRETCLAIGHALHNHVCEKGHAFDVRVGTALINMYSKCDSLLEAIAVFSASPQHDTVSYNAMLTALVEHGKEEQALQLYRQMLQEGMESNHLTFVVALQACGEMALKEDSVLLKERSIKGMSLDIGQALHSDGRRKGFTSDVLVGNTLLSMYCHCGAMTEAENVFHMLSHPDIISWNVMLSAYNEQGQAEMVLQMFEKLQKDHVTLEDVTLCCIMQACCDAGNLEVLRQLHFNAISYKFDKVMKVVSTVLHAYGSCACMLDSQATFHMLPEPDVVSWNACISGHAGEGDSNASLHQMEGLKLTGLKPNEMSFSSVLVACTHTGLVVEGLSYFDSMTRIYDMTPDWTNVGNVVDLLGRSGDFNRIEDLLGRMPAHFNLSKLVCMLGACRIHGNMALARQAFLRAVDIQPNLAAIYVLMSNILTEFEMQEDGFGKHKGVYSTQYLKDC